LGSEKTNYIVVGTILHFDSLLARLTSKDREEFHGFERMLYRSVIRWADNQTLWNSWSQIYRCKERYADKTGDKASFKFFEDNKKAMLEGTEVLWPEKEDYYGLMVNREDNGHFSFESEKQNEPKDLSTLTLDMEKVDWWEDKHQNVDDLTAYLETRKMVVLGAVDPAIKKSKRSDYSAIITALMDGTNGHIYVIDADIKKLELDSLVKRICEYQRIHNYSSFVYEANQAQEWLGKVIMKEPVNVPITPVTNTQSKEGRIAKLMLLIEQGKVKLSKKLGVLNRQLSYYPSGTHDDGIDALAMLVDMSEDFPQAGMEEMKELIGKILKQESGPQQISKIDPISGKTIYIDNPYGLLRIKRPNE
jgi:predicted phage terminase large subunit-like protein